MALSTQGTLIEQLRRDHVRLIRINGLTEAFANRIAPALREKFLDLLRESRLERDLE